MSDPSPRGKACYRHAVIAQTLGTWSAGRWLDVIDRLGRCDGLAWLDGDGTQPLGLRSYVGVEPVAVVERHHGDPAPLSALDELDRGAPVLAEFAHMPRWIGNIAYDAAWSMPCRAPRHIRSEPVLRFARYDALLERNHQDGQVRVVADSTDAASRLRDRMAAPHSMPEARVGAVDVTDALEHTAAIERAREHIAAGDIYQVNLARCWSAPFTGSPLALFLAMRRASPVPLGVYIDAGAHSVCSRSMERFVCWSGNTLETRPIKGTIRREGNDATESLALANDDKERAEHVMIVDLMRNDLGRVAEVGSVEVVAALEVEAYAKLHHLVTTVRCTTRLGTSLRDVLTATFPPGSVTGAPKSRAIEIIEALEPQPRGVYCGCVGHIDQGGGANLAVAIRTAVVRAQRVRYFAGGGLVWPSVAAREVAETELKARVFLDALHDMTWRPDE